MGRLASALGLRSFENPSTPLSNPAAWLLDLAGGDTDAGVAVSPRSSLQVAAVFACVRVLAESVASLPLVLYERMDRGKKRATADPLYHVLHNEPNDFQTSFTFREVVTAHVCLWGNGYARIVRDGAARVLSLLPLEPWTVTPRRVNGSVVYDVRLADGTGERLQDQDVLHVRGLGLDGLVGLSPISLARRAVGIAVATEKFGAQFFGNGARPGGLLEHPGVLGEDARKNLRESWAALHGGPDASHRLAILEEGMKYTAVGIPPEDAQFLETRKFQVSEIARIFRVPPHLVGDLEKATFSNIEQQSIDFVTHTLRPWLVRWEQEFARKILPRAARGKVFVEFLVDGLLRGDTKARFDAYGVGRQWGWYSADDVRELENLNPLPDGAGTSYLTPVNMAVAGSPSPEAQPTAATRDRLVSLQSSHLPVVVDGVARGLRRVAAAATRGLASLEVSDARARSVEVNRLVDGEAASIARDLRPSIYSHVLAVRSVSGDVSGAEDPATVADRVAAEYARTTVETLRASLGAAAESRRVAAEVSGWTTTLANEVAAGILSRASEEATNNGDE